MHIHLDIYGFPLIAMHGLAMDDHSRVSTAIYSYIHILVYCTTFFYRVCSRTHTMQVIATLQLAQENIVFFFLLGPQCVFLRNTVG